MIENQKVHHQKKTFSQEYKGLLKKFEVDYDEKYVFKDLTDTDFSPNGTHKVKV